MLLSFPDYCFFVKSTCSLSLNVPKMGSSDMRFMNLHTTQSFTFCDTLVGMCIHFAPEIPSPQQQVF